MGSVLFCLGCLGCLGSVPKSQIPQIPKSPKPKSPANSVNIAILHSILKFNLCIMRVSRVQKRERPVRSGLSVLELKTKIK